MLVNVSHYAGNNANAHLVEIRGLCLYFSYNECIAFRHYETGLVVSENCWSHTTAKHINEISTDKRIRVSRREFENKLNELLEKLGI